jgi:hypothetical protein
MNAQQPSSWIVIDRNTGLPVCETFNQAIAAKINEARYEVLPALQWLQRFNASVKPSA